MELAALIVILVLLWYYGHWLKVYSEAKITKLDSFSYLLNKLFTSLDELSFHLKEIESHLANVESHISDSAHSADVEWKYFIEAKIDPMLEKFEEIDSISHELSNISQQLDSIKDQVEAIAAHPAFTSSEDDDYLGAALTQVNDEKKDSK